MSATADRPTAQLASWSLAASPAEGSEQEETTAPEQAPDPDVLWISGTSPKKAERGDIVSINGTGFTSKTDIAVRFTRTNATTIADDIVERSLEVADAMPPEGDPSMLADPTGRRPLELYYLSGLVVRLGRELGADVPFHEIAYATLEFRQAGMTQPTPAP